jgi:enoyl-CoA hydratase
MERRGDVVLVGLDRPDKRNALDEAMVAELHDSLTAAAREPSILVIHSTTANIFMSGGDIAQLIERDADDALRAINAGLFERVEAHRWPTIAVIDGPAFGGGCELAISCDFRIASSRSRFAQPELGLGILAGAGANWRLPQLVGISVARRMLFAGEVLDAEAALAAGLVDEVHEPDEVLDAALSLTERILKQSWRALELTKLAIRLQRPATTLFDITGQALLFEGSDKMERMQAFLDRRAKRD